MPSVQSKGAARIRVSDRNWSSPTKRWRKSRATTAWPIHHLLLLNATKSHLRLKDRGEPFGWFDIIYNGFRGNILSAVCGRGKLTTAQVACGIRKCAVDFSSISPGSRAEPRPEFRRELQNTLKASSGETWKYRRQPQSH